MVPVLGHVAGDVVAQVDVVEPGVLRCVGGRAHGLDGGVDLGDQEAAYDVTGDLGALLAALAIFGIVQVQSSASMPQENQQVINYNS